MLVNWKKVDCIKEFERKNLAHRKHLIFSQLRQTKTYRTGVSTLDLVVTYNLRVQHTETFKAIETNFKHVTLPLAINILQSILMTLNILNVCSLPFSAFRMTFLKFLFKNLQFLLVQNDIIIGGVFGYMCNT